MCQGLCEVAPSLQWCEVKIKQAGRDEAYRCYLYLMLSCLGRDVMSHARKLSTKPGWETCSARENATHCSRDQGHEKRSNALWLTQCVCGENLNLIGSNSSAKVNQLSLSNGWPHNHSNCKAWFGDDQGVMPAIPPWFHKWVRRYARYADSLSQAKAPKQATLMKDELERSIDIDMASVLGWWSSRV